MPGKGKQFRSYGKRYKLWLSDNPTFATQFTQWFRADGKARLSEKREEGTPLFDEYYKYAQDELLTFF